MIKDGIRIVLTKEEAIEWHRKMWNWIADQYKEGSKRTVWDLKETFCFKNGIDDLINDCFCCDYASNYSSDNCTPECGKCPIVWNRLNNHHCYCDSKYALYRKIVDLTEESCSIDDTKKAEELARKIANLPVKEW